MDLKLTEHVKNTTFLLYKKNPGEISIFGTFLEKKINFGLYFAEIGRHFQVGRALLRHCDVTR